MRIAQKTVTEQMDAAQRIKETDEWLKAQSANRAVREEITRLHRRRRRRRLRGVVKEIMIWT